MVRTTGSKRLERMLSLARAHRPGLRLVDKQEVWWMRWLAVVVRPVMPGFLTRVTTVIGDTIYTPGAPEALPPDRLARIVAHELVHQLDQQRWGMLFYLSYVLVLPTWRTCRARWERRAYAVDLMLALHEDGPAGLELARRRLIAVFSGPMYGWMWGGRVAAAAFLQPVVDALASGELQRQAPYDDVLQAWVGEARASR